MPAVAGIFLAYIKTSPLHIKKTAPKGLVMAKRILLVDNSTLNLEIQEQLFRETPVKVFTSEIGPKAVELARRLRPDLVYIDLAPPGMEGAACCMAIKREPGLEGTQVVLMATPGEREIEESRMAGCDAFLPKPLDRRRFVALARTLLSKSRGLDQRVPCRASVACRRNGTIFYGAIEDLDVSGMFVRSDFAVKTGERLEIRFFVPETGSGMIETLGRVCWVNNGKVRLKPQLPPGFGIVFEGLDPFAAASITEYLERSMLWQKLTDAW